MDPAALEILLRHPQPVPQGGQPGALRDAVRMGFQNGPEGADTRQERADERSLHAGPGQGIGVSTCTGGWLNHLRHDDIIATKGYIFVSVNRGSDAC